MNSKIDPEIQRALHAGLVIPAHPLALDASRHLDERRQRALTRYYIDAEREELRSQCTRRSSHPQPAIGLFRPVLQLAAEEVSRADGKRSIPLVRIGGICGDTPQALREARVSMIFTTMRAFSAWRHFRIPMTSTSCALPCRGGSYSDRWFLFATIGWRTCPFLWFLAKLCGN